MAEYTILLINYCTFFTGPAITRRGDRIRCTVMLQNKQEEDGKVKVPVLLTLNGKKIRGGDDHIAMEYDEPLYPYIGMTHGCSVLAKVKI